jgi:hypothetical protein
MDVLVLALLLVPAPDRRPDGFDDDDLATGLRHSATPFSLVSDAAKAQRRLNGRQLLLY